MSKELATSALGSALALVSPAGFTQADRELWLKAAVATLKDVPDDLLRIGIVKARLTADHPSKIVPAIMAEIGEIWDSRKRRAGKPVPHSALPRPTMPEAPPLSDVELLAMSPYLRRLGLKVGDIDPERVTRLGLATSDLLTRAA